MSGRTLRSCLLAAVASSWIVALPAQAQEKRQQIRIEAQDLRSSLKAVSRQSGQEIIFADEVVEGRYAPRVEGKYTAEEAVHVLLAGTSLTSEIRGGAIVVGGRPAPSGSVAEGPADDELLVTGTRIRGTRSASPTIVTSREEMLAAGQTDLGIFARALPQNYSGGQNPGIAGGGNQGGQENPSGSSAFNLRGLGPSATLTLLNGHRVAYDTVGQGVDISQIPVAAVERVDVVTDGASALYGSDAVGGVANVILRRDYRGIQASARFGASTDGGNVQQQYSVVTGSSWDGGGFMVASDFSHATPIFARERSYTQSLDRTATLIPGQSQISLVAAGHQRLGGNLALEFDAQFNDRISQRVQPFLATSPATSNGLIARPHVRSFSATPTLRLSMTPEWTVSLTGTYAESNNHIFSRRYTGGAESLRGNVLYDNRMISVEGSTEGRLFAISGGDVRLALGGGYREAGLRVNLTQKTPTGPLQTTVDFNKARQVAYGYSELSVPLVSALNRLPGIETLSLSAALRYEDYLDVAGLATPKLGIIYQPIPDITLRGSWGKSFKAQTLYQEFQVRQGVLLPSVYFAGSPANTTVLTLAGGNSHLKPEKATTWAVSGTVAPRAIPGLAVDLSYFHIDYTDRVVQPLGNNLYSAFLDPIYARYITANPSAAYLAGVVAALPQGISNATGQPYDPASVSAILDASLQNAAVQALRGVDIAARYDLDAGTNKFRLTASASHLTSRQQLSAGQPTTQLAGLIFNPPKWRGRAGIAWNRRSFGLSTFANYVGGTVDNRTSSIARVRSFASVDTVATIKTDDAAGPFRGINLTLAVLNLLNEKPAVIRNSNPADPPYDSTNYSAVGRSVSLTITKAW